MTTPARFRFSSMFAPALIAFKTICSFWGASSAPAASTTLKYFLTMTYKVVYNCVPATSSELAMLTIYREHREGCKCKSRKAKCFRAIWVQGILRGENIRKSLDTTQLLSKGVPVSEVAAILGNSPRIVEKHYSQWIQARQTALEAAVKGTW